MFVILTVIALCFQVMFAATYPGHCRFIQCDPAKCINSIPPGPGECCPKCPPSPLPPINIPDCTVVRCAKPDCDNPVKPPGQCCPICPPVTPPPNCAAVLCDIPICFHPTITPPGQCCPICPPKIPTGEECLAVQCQSPSCPNPLPPSPGNGECCPKCLEDCRVILCARPDCDNPITPRGRCCPVCPPSTPSPPSPPVNCREIQCDVPLCPNPVLLPGDCCPSCPEVPPTNCEGVECEPPLCSNPSPPGPGECCPTCLPIILNTTIPIIPTIRPPPLPTIAPPTTPPIVCPPGVPVTACLINPCDVTTCPAFPRARCVFDNCGGCNARYFVGSREVTDICNGRPPSCPIRGQVFQGCRSCPATCSTPDLACAAVCIPGCGCPFGQLIDEVNNRCVEPTQCPGTRDKCSLPREVGPCRAYFPRYFYNSLTRRCERFVYGGCRGNANNFVTFEECQDECDKTHPTDICSLPSDSGPCEAAITRYFFDGKRCTRFVYGGCRGNANNFRSILECRRKCPGNEISPVNKCTLPHEPGPCRGAFLRYFYDIQTRQCRPFIYGGCQGNANNFQTQKECHHKCKGISSSPKLCLLPRETGPCRAYIPRYFYNTYTKQCERFIYGGCAGNDNNFVTRSECEERCEVSSSGSSSLPPVCSKEYCAGRPNSICTLPLYTRGTIIRRPSHCDITVCKACYHSHYPLPHPRLHRRCPQVIPLFGGGSTCSANSKLLHRWGYCIFKAYKRTLTYRKNEGTFRCWRPPFPYYG